MGAGRGETWAGAAARGLLAGAIGSATAATAERIEQAISHRPTSYVPAHTLQRLLRLPDRRPSDRLRRNRAMQAATGLLGGVVLAMLRRAGMRGPLLALVLAGVRVSMDEVLQRALLATPRQTRHLEQAVRLGYTMLYAAAAGWVVERLVWPRPRRRKWSRRAVALTRRSLGFR